MKIAGTGLARISYQKQQDTVTEGKQIESS